MHLTNNKNYSLFLVRNIILKTILNIGPSDTLHSIQQYMEKQQQLLKQTHTPKGRMVPLLCVCVCVVGEWGVERNSCIIQILSLLHENP